MFYKVSLFLLGLGLMAPAPVMAQEVTPDRCEAVLRDLTDGARTMSVDFRARYSGLSDGVCEYSDLRLKTGAQRGPSFFADRVTLSGSILGWKPGERLGSSDMSLTAEGLRFAMEMGDPRMDYLLDAQSKVGAMSLDLRLGWDAGSKQLSVGRFDLATAEMSLIRLNALVKNVDLSSPGAMQMALTGFAVTDLDLEVKTFGLFESYLLPLMINLLPDVPPDAGAEGFARIVSEQKLALRSAINQLPDAAFPAPSRAALAGFLSDLPSPRGKFVVSFRSPSGFGPARFARFALTGMPETIRDAAPLFDDTRFDIQWRRGDRS